MPEEAKPNIGNLLGYLLILILTTLGVVFLFSKNPNINNKNSINNTASSSSMIKNKYYQTAPKINIDQNKKYIALLVTSQGKIKIELFAKETPITVNNFIFLTKEGFYKNVLFHRVIKDFMIQTGDPLGNGSGGPGYTFEDEKITRDYKRGIVAMANRGPNTNGSQFFIIHKDSNLPKNYVIFGQVIEGIDVVDKIAQVTVVENQQGEKSQPTEQIKIDNIEIIDN